MASCFEAFTLGLISSAHASSTVQSPAWAWEIMRDLIRMGAVDGFRFWLEAKGLAKTTIKNYIGTVKVWENWCSGMETDYRQAGRDDMTAWLGRLAETQLQSTVRLRLLGLRVFYDYLLDEELVDDNPARKIKLRKQEARPTDPFSHDQMGRLLLACQSYQERATLLLLIGSGLRRSEVFRIRRDDINFEARTIRILGKGSQYRIVAPGVAAIEALQAALTFQEHLFLQKDEEIVYRIVRRLAKRAGIKGRVYPHRFRHTFAVEWCEAEGGVDKLQMVLGHRTLEMTLFYSRANREQRAIETQERLSLADKLLSNISAPAELVS